MKIEKTNHDNTNKSIHALLNLVCQKKIIRIGVVYQLYWIEGSMRIISTDKSHHFVIIYHFFCYLRVFHIIHNY